MRPKNHISPITRMFRSELSYKYDNYDTHGAPDCYHWISVLSTVIAATHAYNFTIPKSACIDCSAFWVAHENEYRYLDRFSCVIRVVIFNMAVQCMRWYSVYRPDRLNLLMQCNIYVIFAHFSRHFSFYDYRGVPITAWASFGAKVMVRVNITVLLNENQDYQSELKKINSKKKKKQRENL